MNSKSSNKPRKVIAPECRGGTTTEVIERASTAKRSGAASHRSGSYIERVLSSLRYDKNLAYLAARLQNYSEITDARMVSIRQAVCENDQPAIVDLAHSLTDSTAKLGAIRMMKIGRAHV